MKLDWKIKMFLILTAALVVGYSAYMLCSMARDGYWITTGIGTLFVIAGATFGITVSRNSAIELKTKFLLAAPLLFFVEFLLNFLVSFAKDPKSLDTAMYGSGLLFPVAGLWMFVKLILAERKPKQEKNEQ